MKKRKYPEYGKAYYWKNRDAILAKRRANTKAAKLGLPLQGTRPQLSSEQYLEKLYGKRQKPKD